jgi:hypothetical protein
MRSPLLVALLGCGCSTWSTRRRVAAETLRCPERRLETFFPHHNNRGCGRDAIVACTVSSSATLNRPVYVSAR